jgi:long-chain fatty acid transport protein
LRISPSSGLAPEPHRRVHGNRTHGIDLAQTALGVTYARELGASAGLGITRQSIGITPILAAQRFKARGLQPFKALSVSPDHVTNNGYDYSYGGGVRVGWLGSLLRDQLNVGISYQSKLWMTDFDEYEGLFAKGGNFDIPAIFNIGLAFMITPKLTMVADFRRIFYDDIDSLSNTNDITLNQIIANPDNRLGGDDGLGFGWDDINVYLLGCSTR